MQRGEWRGKPQWESIDMIDSSLYRAALGESPKGTKFLQCIGEESCIEFSGQIRRVERNDPIERSMEDNTAP